MKSLTGNCKRTLVFGK